MDTKCSAVIILLTIILFGLICWAMDERNKRKARQKYKAVEPVDYTGIIKERGRELREITYRRKVN